MPTWLIITLVAVVFLYLIGNILMVKQTANLEMPDLLGKQAAAKKKPTEQADVSEKESTKAP